MPPPPKSRFRRFCRVAWRIARTSLVVLVIVLGTLVLWLTEVGLPDFMKQRLVGELRSRGVEFQFSRIRLRWRRGVVAEHVNFGKTKEQFGPQFSAERVEFHLDQSALKHFKLVPDAMKLKQGRLVLPLPSQQESPQSFSFDNIYAELLFQSGDRWELKNLQARALGVSIQLAGTLANASFARQWQWPQPPEEKIRATNFWYQLVTQLEKIKWNAPAELTCGIQGDARDFNSFTADLRLSAPALESPWASANHLLLSLLWSPPPASNDLPRVEIKLDASQVKSPWGEAGLARLRSDFRPLFGQRWLTNLTKEAAAESALEPSLRSPGLASGKMELTLQTPQFSQGRAENLQFDANFKLSAADTNVIETDLSVSAQQLETDWGAATNAAILAHVSHALTNLVPLTATGRVEVAQGRTTWGNARRAQVDFAIKRIGAPPAWKANSIEEWLTLLNAFTLDWETRVSQAEAPKLQLESVSSQGQWRAPHLLVPKLHADLYGGEVAASARLDTATRELTVNGNSTFDVQKIIPLLSTNTQAWLADYSWEKVTKLEAQLRLILPAWTNRHPDWSAEVRPTMNVQGDFQVLGGGFRGLPFTSAQSSFSFSNLVWRLPDLQVTRPEGTLHLSHVADKQVKNFHWLVRGRIDPKALKLFLKTDEQKQVLDDFEFTEPPTVEAEIWGRSNDALQLGVTGALHARNFSFRRQEVLDFTAAAHFTNQFLRATGVQIQRPEGKATVERVGFDLADKKLYITNAVCGLDKDAVAAGLGKKVGKTLTPYEFSAPPNVRVNGTFDLMKGRSLNDARFEVNGGPFQWKKFRCPRIHGKVHWLGDDVTLTNVVAEFYGGQIAGHAFFDATPASGTGFSFLAMIAEVNLHTLMADLLSKTNKLEGILDGDLTIDSANTDDPKSWRGHGRVNLRDGLIWEFPIFGIFSPVLNAVSPGLGNSRARQGSATFTIKLGAVQSKDLEIHSSGARLNYSGAVDFDAKVRGKMEAELFRDLPIFGKIMSLALWPVTKIFEYKISGTLAQPKAEPVYVPGFLVHPLRSIKGMFPEEPKPPPEK